jgi:hypothetical protein
VDKVDGFWGGSDRTSGSFERWPKLKVVVVDDEALNALVPILLLLVPLPERKRRNSNKINAKRSR